MIDIEEFKKLSNQEKADLIALLWDSVEDDWAKQRDNDKSKENTGFEHNSKGQKM